METSLTLAYLVQFGALAAAVAALGALVVSTVAELVLNKRFEGGVVGSAPAQKPVKNNAF